ncbi:MAG: hypothetical protein AVDCRST_MAG16-3004, partial [uncultured Frankineae bacterium]
WGRRTCGRGRGRGSPLLLARQRRRGRSPRRLPDCSRRRGQSG